MISWATCAPTQLSILQSCGLGCCHVGRKPLQLQLPGDTDHPWTCITSLLPLGVARPGHHGHLGPGNSLWGRPVHVGCLAASLALPAGPQEQLASCLVITKHVSRCCQMSSRQRGAIPSRAGGKYSRPRQFLCVSEEKGKREFVCVCALERDPQSWIIPQEQSEDMTSTWISLGPGRGKTPWKGDKTPIPSVASKTSSLGSPNLHLQQFQEQVSPWVKLLPESLPFL